MVNNGLLGVVWDFDGLMAETKYKNYIVTKKIVSDLKGIPFESVGEVFPVFKTFDTYEIAIDASTNWQDFYADNTDMEVMMIMDAGKVWAEYQLKDHTVAKFFPGIEDTVVDLAYILPNPGAQAVASMNSKENIMNTLDCIHMYFSGVVGYEEVSNGHQKPHPLPLTMAIESFNPEFDPGYVFSIGDTETDSQMAANFNRIVNIPITVVHYAGTWGMRKNDVSEWEFQPYGVINHPSEIIDEIRNFTHNDYEMLENGVIRKL